MKEKFQLVSEYEEQSQMVDKLQNQLNLAKENARATLGELLSVHGKGPYTVNDKEVVVLRRKGTLCTMPKVRVRKNKTVKNYSL